MTSFALLCLLCATAAAAIQTATRRMPGMLLAAVGDDEDIKIATGHFKQPDQDVSERAARDFLKQKQSGNVDQARELGKQLAQAVLDVDCGPLAGEMTGKPMQVQHHLYLLYTYVVNRVIAELSPDSILAQTSLNVYYSEIEGESPALYTHVSDMAAFSLYILCERSNNQTDDQIGRIFADLCGLEDKAAMEAYGNALYRKFHDACAAIVKRMPYNPVE